MTDRTVERRKSSPQHRAEYAAAQAAPTEHLPRLVTTPQVRHLIHGAGAIGQFNSRLAVLITKSVGTMWAAYLFMLIGLVSLPQAWHAFIRGDTVTGVAWLSQSFLQLVLLPIIIVGQNIISASQDARAEADHITLSTLHAMNVRQLQMLEQQQKILLQQQTILDLLKPKAP
ncbi:MAG: hypothetical protein ACYDA0_05910 [Candidatus Dormibacteraceae bacterium]